MLDHITTIRRDLGPLSISEANDMRRRLLEANIDPVFAVETSPNGWAIAVAFENVTAASTHLRKMGF